MLLGHTHPCKGFRIHYRIPFSLHAGKGNCCMWLVNNVEIHFRKICFMVPKWTNLNVPWSYTHWCHSLLGSSPLCDCPRVELNSGPRCSGLPLFPACKERNCCMWHVNIVESYFPKMAFISFHRLQMDQFKCPWVINLLVLLFTLETDTTETNRRGGR